MKISVLIGTRNRTEPLRRCIESVLRQDRRPDEILVLDDASDAVDVGAFLRGARLDAARVVRTDEQLGVGRGRNLLMRSATGDVFFVLDDDAWLESPDIIGCLERAFDAHPGVGIIAGRIRDHREDGVRDLIPFPHRARRGSADIAERPQFTSYFLGGGHGVRRSLAEQLGGYDPGFVWGEEELDLSFRSIQVGFMILYAPDVVVHHRAMSGVLASAQQPRSELYYHVRNRLLIAWKYLPGWYVPAYLGIWLLRYLASATSQRRGLRELIQGIVDGLRFLRRTRRAPVAGEALEYLRRHHGRLLY